MSVGRRCEGCDGKSSRAARFCQWCGAPLRALERWEEPRGDELDRRCLEAFRQQAERNVETWGEQSIETLLLATIEELGELTQAHLEAVAEGGDPRRRREELGDLGALPLQLAWALAEDRPGGADSAALAERLADD